MTDPVQFQDIAQYDLAKQQLARRRRIAEELMAQRAPVSKMQGDYAILAAPGDTMAAGIDRAFGNFDNNRIDQAELANNLAARDASDSILSSIPASGPERTQAQIKAMGNPSLRAQIQAMMGVDEAEAKRIEAGEQSAANRVETAAEKEANRVFLAEQKDLDRQNRLDAKATPSIHITTGGAGPTSFGGAAPVIGSNPRDDSPVYRHTKSGQLFQYDENGQPTPYAGVVAPKPVAPGNPTESERGAAGYLGRMQATEQNLANAKPFNLPTQMGLDRAPNATNFVLTPEQQVQRQQQEDWVRAKLRKESGAVIGDEEMAREIRTYFPMAGDSDKVIASKRQSRAQAMEQMKSSAGRSTPTIAKPVAAPVQPSSRLKFNPATGKVE